MKKTFGRPPDVEREGENNKLSYTGDFGYFPQKIWKQQRQGTPGVSL